jgi:hypothetical protein
MDTDLASAPARRADSKIRIGSRILAVGITVLAVNLLIYTIGRASGGSFTSHGRAYDHPGALRHEIHGVPSDDAHRPYPRGTPMPPSPCQR